MWVIPASNMKAIVNGDHVGLLSDQAVTLLQFIKTQGYSRYRC